MAKVRDEYWVQLKGRRHPLYAGVLVAAHEAGLLGIEVTILQYPTQENGMSAVCSALVTMKGDEGRDLVFQDVGDASGANVGSMIVPHIIRMASTRAKGRALRDSIALGVALVEELGGGDDDQMAGGVHQNGSVRGAGGSESPSPRAVGQPAARAAAPPLAAPPSAGSPPAGPVVGAESGPASCELCGVPLTNSQRLISEKHFGGRHLCPTDQRNERVALGTRAQSTHAPA